MTSVEAGDYTLAGAACGSVPGHGMDVCRVREGAFIESSWKLILPAKGEGILGGEVDVYYRDVHHSYAVTDNVLEIPWRDFFGSDVWRREFDGEALALAVVRYKTPEGLEEEVKFRGIAKIIVTKAGYDRLPIDSGYVGWKKTCKVQYTTAGRGALECR
jgi:hypothetical protein